MKPLLLALLLPITGFCDVLTMTPMGPSMLPVLPEFSVQRVDTSPEAFNRIQLGSIVVFRDPSSPTGRTCHYVFEKRGPGVWWPRGANKRTNRLPDRVYVTRENFVGLLLDVSVNMKQSKKRS
jgi:hypothetical protein